MVTQNEKEQLLKLLHLKLKKVPPFLMPAITIDEILTATTLQGGNWPFADDVEVPYGATLRVILEHRVTNCIYALERRPLNTCDPHVLLSYLRSNFDENMSFDTYFRQTRLRCYMTFSAKQKGKATQVQMAYLFACLEEIGYGIFADPQKPCNARIAFITELMANPQDFMVFGKSKGRNILAKISKKTREFRDKHNNGVIKCLFETQVESSVTYVGLPDTLAPACREGKRGKRGRKSKAPTTNSDEDANDDADAMDVTDDKPPSEILVIDGRSLQHLRREHPILDKLMVRYPGYMCVGEEAFDGKAGSEDARLTRQTSEDAVVDDLADDLAIVSMTEEESIHYLRDDWFLISKSV